ncbi:hypothetical protein PCNPT3_06690 [Psychromonas sp. CNPT3]|uniref:hypothetical protein n=1 Tax=Psychromonas sp. CNPT3 TaxID=314282 RepID=UPI00006E2D3C|nr:hypothetical protein [Psychromonas sp. CNPT3]AGH81276.1 hypothetical protein PCNPT3_06690 [Psychromonas sp. CNPT3]
MKKIMIGFLMLSAVNTVTAFDNRDAVNLVKKFSSTVACSINDDSYKVVKTRGEKGIDESDDQYVVYWEGDLECFGGRGTINPVFSVVLISGFNDPVVLTKIKQPRLPLVCIDYMEKEGELLNVYGIAYGSNDNQGNPNKKMKFSLNLDDMKGVFSVVSKSEDQKMNISNKCVGRVR